MLTLANRCLTWIVLFSCMCELLLMIRSLMSLWSNLNLGKNKREFILYFFLSQLDSHSYALIDNWSQFCFLLVISEFWLYKEKKLSVHFHTSAPTLAPLLQMAQRREVNFAFFTLLSYCPLWNVLQRWERGTVVTSGLYSTPLF